MPECARCHDFTDNSPDGDYHYCDDCLDQFSEVEQSGVVVEHDTNGEVHVIVTGTGGTFSGGVEQSQVDGLARGKNISEEMGLPALFKYNETGSRWLLDEYLEEHPDIRKEVHERLRRLPDDSSGGILARIREFF
jgi:hypothetical protein